MNIIQRLGSKLFRIKPTIVRVPSMSGESQRMYANAKTNRLTGSLTSSSNSADAELASSLPQLRSRGRSLNRDSPYAKRAKTVVVNNTIGTGIGMQAQVKTSRDELNARVNDDIEEAFEEWSYASNCHTGGRLCFADMERLLMGEVEEAGDVYVRKYFSAFGDSKVPYALEIIEAERLADDLAAAQTIAPGNQFRMGVEMDRFYRPVAYHIRSRHPSEFNWYGDAVTRIERVPASQIIPLSRTERWPQTRGVPLSHTTAITLDDMEGYSEAMIVKARTQACIVGAIETPEGASSFADKQADGTYEMPVGQGTYKRLNPGEKLTVGPANSPSPEFPEFMRAKLREVAAGMGVSYESLSRDYSQSNYSSSRMGLLEDRDVWRDYQQWFIRSFRQIVHREWLQQAVFAGAIPSIDLASYMSNRAKFEAVRFRPRGWSWVDPTTEVEAYEKAVRCGFMSLQDVITATSDRDVEEVFEDRKKERQMAEKIGLVLDTDPEQTNGTGAVQVDPNPPPTETTPPKTETTPPSRGFSFLKEVK